MTEQQQRHDDETSTADDSAEASPAYGDVVVAPPDKRYRLKFTIMLLVALAVGAWFGYDGFVGWPEQNRKLAEVNAQLDQAQKDRDSAQVARLSEEQKNYTAHTQMSIDFQKVLCAILPLIGLAVFARTMYGSRGQLRLESDTLHFPGHPPVQLDSIVRIDKTRWERKGIAYLVYEQGGKTGTLKVDDFAYERGPTDEIFKRVEAYLLPAGGEAAAPTEA